MKGGERAANQNKKKKEGEEKVIKKRIKLWIAERKWTDGLKEGEEKGVKKKNKEKKKEY